MAASASGSKRPILNADHVFQWSIPSVHLESSPGPSSKEHATRGRKRKRTLPISHFDLINSRIDPPDFFSMHLRHHQILVDIHQSPALPQVLASLVDDYMVTRTPPDLPTIAPLDDLAPRARMQFKHRCFKTSIEDEGDISSLYEFPERMAARVASTLYTHSSTWVDGLEWKRQAPQGMTHAVAGGYLYISHRLSSGGGSQSAPPDSKLFDRLNSLRRNLPIPGFPIVPWVFVPAGPPYGIDGDEFFEDDGMIFEIIQEMAEGNLEFTWTACESDTPLHASCNVAQHYNVFGQLSKTGHCMTDDALCTKDILASADSTIHVRSLTTGKIYSLSLVRRAGFVAQRAWTVAVAIDATYVVISTGGEEMIAIRNRHDRSFHFSGALVVSRDCAQSVDTPSYLKLHTGLILAALKDLDQRISQRLREEEPYHSKEFFDIDAADFPARIRLKHPRENAAEIPRDLRWPVGDVHVFLGRQSEVSIIWPTDMPIPLFTGMSQPYTFQRSEAHIKKFHFTGPVEKTPVIMIHTEIDSTTFLCHLKSSEGLPMGNYFVAKFSRGWMATGKLRSEASVYGHFQEYKALTGIPSCFGLFESQVLMDGSAQLGLLLLEACDKPMAAQTRISASIKNELRHWLGELHEAGIVHGKLSPTNIMFNQDKHGLYIRVLSWGNAENILRDDWQDLPGAEFKRQQDRNALEAAFAEIQGLLKKEKAKKTREDKKVKLAKKLKTA